MCKQTMRLVTSSPTVKAFRGCCVVTSSRYEVLNFSIKIRAQTHNKAEKIGFATLNVEYYGFLERCALHQCSFSSLIEQDVLFQIHPSVENASPHGFMVRGGGCMSLLKRKSTPC